MRVRGATFADARQAARAEQAASDLARRLSGVAARLAEGDEVILSGDFGEVTVERAEGELLVLPFDVASWPFVRAALALPGSTARFGVPALDPARARRRVLERTGVDVGSFAVRVGVTRGHMLEVSWAVPLDVPGDVDSLEEAADLLTEALLGTEVFERWVRVNAVVRAARRSALRAVAPADEVERYPLSEARALLERAIDLIRASLPRSLLDESAPSWTALDIGESAALGRQNERTFASTTQPEALKCFLEGATFWSGRFTRGVELFGSVECAFSDHRLAERARFEERFLALGARGRLVGSGFGGAVDYFDFVARDDEEEVLSFVEALRGFEGARALRLFDRELGDGTISLR